ncbi:RNA-directed DNA polymerase from mobile element jockey [Elysia marginata]|uniref:RNA-directed DNA polymerase from mobile element jockey n=1 Tax=Elysia marginata TaxID=1093978 RepID=A0AAV4J561_9GAST|nr:RNA-directed DNA polymerase from mobile element jockey [Elysia marginata]
MKGALGKDHHITKTNRGLLVEVRDNDIEKNLLSLKAMAGVPIRATPVVSHPDLKRCKEEEFVKKVPGVTFAKHIQFRRGEETVPTSTIVLTFDSPSPPTQTKAGHAADNCKNDSHFVNCRGDHAASDKVCPKYAEEQAILRYRAYNGGTFQQARAAVVLEVAKEVRPTTYAQVTRKEPTDAPVASASAPALTSKTIQVTPGTRELNRNQVSAPAKASRTEHQNFKRIEKKKIYMVQRLT